MRYDIMRKVLGIVLALCFMVGLSSVTRAATGPIVSTKWLSKNLHKKGLVILDVRTFEKYEKSHIPGAVKAFGPWQTMNEKFVGFMMPPVYRLVEMLRSYGVSNDSFVVVYDHGMTSQDTAKSARVIWTLHFLGHTKCAILDGGFNAWDQAELPETKKPTIPMRGDFTASIVASKVITLDDVKKRLGSHKTIFVDARDPMEHFGHEKKAHIPRYGHLPGSLLMPADALTIGGQNFSPAFLRKADELSQLALGVGIPTNKNVEIVVYSNHGLQAALVYFVLNDVLGYKNVRLFDGSILEAAKAKDVPMNMYSWGWTECKK